MQIEQGVEERWRKLNLKQTYHDLRQNRLNQYIGIGSMLKRMYGWQQRNKKNCFSKKFGGNNRYEKYMLAQRKRRK